MNVWQEISRSLQRTPVNI